MRRRVSPTTSRRTRSKTTAAGFGAARRAMPARIKRSLWTEAAHSTSGHVETRWRSTKSTSRAAYERSLKPRSGRQERRSKKSKHNNGRRQHEQQRMGPPTQAVFTNDGPSVIGFLRTEGDANEVFSRKQQTDQIRAWAASRGFREPVILPTAQREALTRTVEPGSILIVPRVSSLLRRPSDLDDLLKWIFDNRVRVEIIELGGDASSQLTLIRRSATPTFPRAAGWRDEAADEGPGRHHR